MTLEKINTFGVVVSGEEEVLEARENEKCAQVFRYQLWSIYVSPVGGN